MFRIWEDPKEDAYSSLIDYSMRKCSYFSLTILDPLDLDIEGQIVLDQLKDFIIKSEREEFRITYYYRFETNSALVLKNAANSLFCWVQPNLPEDLCFYTEQDQCWLDALSHEAIGEFNADDKEAQELIIL